MGFWGTLGNNTLLRVDVDWIKKRAHFTKVLPDFCKFKGAKDWELF